MSGAEKGDDPGRDPNEDEDKGLTRKTESKFGMDIVPWMIAGGMVFLALVLMWHVLRNYWQKSMNRRRTWWARLLFKAVPTASATSPRRGQPQQQPQQGQGQGRHRRLSRRRTRHDAVCEPLGPDPRDPSDRSLSPPPSYRTLDPGSCRDLEDESYRTLDLGSCRHLEDESYRSLDGGSCEDVAASGGACGGGDDDDGVVEDVVVWAASGAAGSMRDPPSYDKVPPSPPLYDSPPAYLPSVSTDSEAGDEESPDDEEDAAL